MLKVLSFSLSLLFSGYSMGDEAAIAYRERQLAKTKVKTEKEKAQAAIEKQDHDSFYDPEFDYSKFTGRVTDRDKSANIFKVSSENGNIRFFRSGDQVNFRFSSKKSDFCQGFVRSVEDRYFVMYVRDLYECLDGDVHYFRRGTMLYFNSPTLAERVRDASLYRLVLLRRRRDFYGQLNQTNHFVWSYNQEKVKVAADYDKQIIELQKAKQRAMELLLVKKSDSIKLQKELSYRLDKLDKDLEFYRIEKDDLLIDRWHLDHDLGLPVGKRPSELKFREF